MMKTQINIPDGQYEFNQYENEILNLWNSKEFFKPEYDPKSGEIMSLEELKKDSRQPWALICPPPNAYDRPHMGNLSGYPYMDALGRFQRMNNKKVLLFPGKDHAGIEGEVTYVKYYLEPKGINKFSLPREEFYKQVFDSQQELIKKITDDEKSIGLSADFERNLYTLDPKVVDEVLGTFIQMYKDGLIYKGVRLVNWDPKSRTAISDSQCERVEREGKIFYIKYPIVKNKVWQLNFRDEETFERIRNNEKTIETRALNPEEKERYFGDIKIGDLLVCNDKTELQRPSIYKKIKKVQIFKSFEEAYENIEWHKVTKNPQKDIFELEREYAEISLGYADKIRQNGLVALEIEDLSDKDFMTVATTRPETMLGDTALVVNPTDERYKDYVGKTVLIPLANREIPVITSGRIEKDFGTGILKLTPAHATEDYEIMREWNEEVEKLERDEPTVFDPVKHKKIGYINIIDKNLKLVGPIPEKYKVLKVNSAKDEIVKDLAQVGFLIREEGIKQNVLISERSGAVVEPMMSSQWFIDVSGFKKDLIDMVANGSVKIHPKYSERKYFTWVNNLRDWAISRNLWWGYRLPVWYHGEIIEKINDEGHIRNYLNINGEEVELDPTNSEHMRVQSEKPSDGWIQDEDILDTWFSSGQWPYICLKTSGLLDTYYPTDVLVSGYDLLIKWDLTMMLFGWYKTGKVPFKELYLTGLVKGTDGQKMSKSKRNFVPIDDVKTQYGIDSFRMNCFYQNKAGRAYAITPQTLKNFRNFNNKLWNAFKYVLRSFDQYKDIDFSNLDKIALHKENYIFEENSEFSEKMNTLFSEVSLDINKFRFGRATEKLYTSFWHEYCDLYIEKTKELLKSENREEVEETLSVLLSSLIGYLKMLHPFIPFVTEKCFQILKENNLTWEESEILMYTSWKI